MRKPEILPLTSLRFFAAACVVFFHMERTFGFSFRDIISAHQSVTFFFTLSGFIMSLAYSNLSGFNDTLKFWILRLARIWPATIASLLLWVFLLPWSPPTFSTGAQLAVFFLDVTMLKSWVPSLAIAFSFNTVTWSISAEVFFYLLFPFLLPFMKQNLRLVCFVTLVALLFLLAVTLLFDYTNPNWWRWYIYVNPALRLTEFVSGMACYQFYAKGQYGAGNRSNNMFVWSLWELAALLFALSSMFLSQQFWSEFPRNSPLTFIAYYVARSSGSSPSYLLLIYIFAMDRGIFSYLLRTRPMVLLGNLSFALYLFHYPLLRIYVMYLYHHLKEQPKWLLVGGFWLVCLTISLMVYTWLEQPCRRLIVRSATRFIGSRVHA